MPSALPAQLVLLDTGTDAQAAQHLDQMGACLDLPTPRLPCGLDYLRLFLTSLVREWRLHAEGRRAPAAATSATRPLAAPAPPAVR